MESLRETPLAYRLIITRRNASEILLAPGSGGWTLPGVEIRPERRVAEQLTAECRRAWGVEVYCLFIPGCGTSGRNGKTSCAVLESVRDDSEASRKTCWMPRTAVPGHGDAEEAAAIRGALEELDSYRRGTRPGPFARPGWLGELFLWVQEQIGVSDLRVTGGFRQLNASPTFSLIRIETEDGALWFKATGEPNGHELPVSVLLARLFPGHVPRILGVHPSWNGWLTADAPGTSLDELSDCSAWERTAEGLAKLQIASIGRSAELLRAGCKNLRIPRLKESIGPFLVRMAEFMGVQEKRIPAPLTPSELVSLAEGLKEACSVLESSGLPETLGHIDCNPGNIVVSPERSVFLDWAEGCVTNPLVTFDYLREHCRRSGVAAAAERLTAAYLRPWAAQCDPDAFQRALTVSPLIAVFAYAVASDSWRSPDSIRNPALAGYFRSLTRRMFREAIHAAERSELCLD